MISGLEDVIQHSSANMLITRHFSRHKAWRTGPNATRQVFTINHRNFIHSRGSRSRVQVPRMNNNASNSYRNPDSRRDIGRLWGTMEKNSNAVSFLAPARACLAVESTAYEPLFLYAFSSICISRWRRLLLSQCRSVARPSSQLCRRTSRSRGPIPLLADWGEEEEEDTVVPQGHHNPC